MRIAINAHYLHRARLSGLGRYAHELASALAGEELVEVRLPESFYGDGTVRRWLRFFALILLEMLVPAVLTAGRRVSWHISPAFSVPLSLFSSRHIVVVHDLAFREFPACYSRRERLYYGFNLFLLRRGAYRIVTPSRYVRDRLIADEGIAPGRIKVISPYPEIAPHRSSSKKRGFLLLSNAHPRKNIQATLEGFAASKAPALGYTLTVAGNFEHLPQAASGIIFLPALSEAELAQAYADAQVLTLFSLSEGFGFPVVEAAACGTSSLTSERTSLAELSDPERPLSSATTADEIAARIDRYLDDPEFRAALDRDRQYVALTFTEDRFRRAWRELLNVQ